MAGTLTVDTIQSDSSYASTLNVASKMNFAAGMQIGGQDTTFGGVRNRLINGNMVVDQRYAGTSVTIPATSITYTVDRWAAYGSQASKFSVQQIQNANTSAPNYESTGAPSGFVNSLKITSASAYSVGASDQFKIWQVIEGYNIADLDWGKSTAKTVTLSFWVKSSLTGNFGGYLRSADANTTYPFTYTISSANTWEQKTITVVGPTTGTWLTTNGIGISVAFGLGVGTTLSGTANAWTGYYEGTTGTTSVVGTSGATFYITGVQLEKGSSASAFEQLHYGHILTLCQRYYEVIGRDSTLTSNAGLLAPDGYAGTGQQINTTIFYKVTKRAAPTATRVGNWNLQNMSIQPLIYGAGVDNLLFYGLITSTGPGYAQNSNAGNYIDLLAEL